MIYLGVVRNVPGRRRLRWLNLTIYCGRKQVRFTIVGLSHIRHKAGAPGASWHHDPIVAGGDYSSLGYDNICGYTLGASGREIPERIQSENNNYSLRSKLLSIVAS